MFICNEEQTLFPAQVKWFDLVRVDSPVIKGMKVRGSRLESDAGKQMFK